MKPHQVYINQIYYDESTRASVDTQFIPLDNSKNERPDWREYWPIREYFINNPITNDTYYGFLSPKFQLKTGLTGKNVFDFIDTNEADVFIFSPYVEQSSFFLNVFEHGEANHPGLLDTMQQFIASIGIPIDLRSIVCDYNNTIFSNYFIAKSTFWVSWLELAEKLFAISESADNPLATALNAPAKYHGAVGKVDMKVFILERLASFLLSSQQYSTKAFDPFSIARSGIPASLKDHEMRIANALKIAFLTTRDSRYIESYSKFRDSFLLGLNCAAG